jgi:tripartite-type tricarboxylate transporter receptor subunit TctC
MFATRVMRVLFAAALAVALATLAATPAAAQSYPAKPIKIIVSLAPGGLADILARAAAQHLGDVGKQSVVVENRTGAGGVIGADAAAKSPPDGYTLYVGLHSTNAILPFLNSKLPYDPAKDFVPVIHIATFPNVLVVNAAVPAKSVSELVAYIKANPGRVSYASQGNGSSGHMAGEQFKQVAGVDIIHVPYRGAAPAAQDLISGQVQMMFDSITLQMAQLSAGTVRALAVTSAQRVAAIPDVPTMSEAGFADVQGGAWFGLFAPTGTPREAIDWLNRETRKAFAASEVRERMLGQGALLPLGSPEDFGAFVAAERNRWGEVIRRGGIKAE